MPSWEFPVSGPADAQIRVPAGDVSLTAAATGPVTVVIEPRDDRDMEAVKVEFTDNRLVVAVRERWMLRGSPGSLDVTVTVPQGSSCAVSAASADISLSGEFASATIDSASGDVTARDATGATEVRTASGDVRLAQAGPATVKTVSGDILLITAAGDVACQSVSGDVTIGAVSGGRVETKTTSGDITVAVVPGIGVDLDLATLTGQAHSDLDYSETGGTATATVICRAVSGDVQVIRSAEAAAR
jgi:DUF4097 and DUF4098 domain-containing protein YvlB